MNEGRRKMAAGCALVAMLGVQLMSPRVFAAKDDDKRQDDSRDHHERRTATPIKHVIVLIGENRTFDNVYATYVPKHGQHVSNLLSKGIVNADGTPGPNRALARQFQLGTINPVSFFISTDKLTAPNKTAYAPFLPTPEAGSAPPAAVTRAQFLKDPAVAAPPFDAHTFSAAQLHTLSPVIVPGDLHLLTSGATGLANCTADPTEPPSGCATADTRISNFNALPNTVFQITGPKVPYDSYTGDMVHRFYHMWQQSDCDVSRATLGNPSGCLNDLYPFVGIARGDDSGSNSMGFYNVQKGDAPVFKRLADEYTMSDNYHQPVMGGTAVQHTMLMTGDQIPWEASGNLPAQPPLSSIVDPTPKSATNVAFIRDQRWTKCGDPTQPGVLPIMQYLQSLPWRPDLAASNCEPGKYYMINNTRPGFLSNGTSTRPPSTPARPFRLQRCGRLATRSTNGRSAGPTTAAATTRRNGSTTDRRIRWTF